MMGVTKRLAAEGPVVTTEDIFGYLHLEGQQIDMGSQRLSRGRESN